MQESENSRPAIPKHFSDAEVREIYEVAAKLESETLFTDEPEGLTQQQLEAGAKRAGISDKALEAAIAAKLQKDEQNARHQKAEAIRKSQLRRQFLIGGAIATGVVMLGALTTQFKLGASRAQVEAQQAQIENVLQRRHDLIPNLISVTKATLDNQRQFVDSINRAQEAVRNAQGTDARQQAENRLADAMQQATAQIQAEAGNSPAALRLIDEMAGTENRIAQERRRYNTLAANYNRSAHGFPYGIFRPLLRYPANYPLFQAEASAHEVPRF